MSILFLVFNFYFAQFGSSIHVLALWSTLLSLSLFPFYILTLHLLSSCSLKNFFYPFKHSQKKITFGLCYFPNELFLALISLYFLPSFLPPSLLPFLPSFSSSFLLPFPSAIYLHRWTAISLVIWFMPNLDNSGPHPGLLFVWIEHEWVSLNMHYLTKYTPTPEFSTAWGHGERRRVQAGLWWMELGPVPPLCSFSDDLCLSPLNALRVCVCVLRWENGKGERVSIVFLPSAWKNLGLQITPPIHLWVWDPCFR